MHAWQLPVLGGPEQLRWVELLTPEPGPTQVRVRIEAAALNFLDTLMLRGQYQTKPPLPFIPGVEFAGIVEAAGVGARLKPGTKVAGVAPTGAFATHIVLEQSQVTEMPAAMLSALAATLPIAYPTAALALYELAQLRSEDRVLITAAAGGVGIAAIQLAKARGAQVVAVASNAKHAECLAQGADVVFSYENLDLVLKNWLAIQRTEGFDVVVDMVGGAVGLAGLKRLAWRGRWLSVGFASGEISQIPANLLLLRQAQAIGVWWGEFSKREAHAAARILADLMKLLAEGTIKPLISASYPMSKLPDALRLLANRKTVGKVVLLNA